MHPVAAYVPLMCAAYIVRALSPEACSQRAKSGIFAGCIRVRRACWRKTNNYCMTLKGGRIWFVKGIIVCLTFCPPTSAAYSSCPFLRSSRIFTSRYFISLPFKCLNLLTLSKLYSFQNYLIVFHAKCAFSAEIENSANLFLIKEVLKSFIKCSFTIYHLKFSWNSFDKSTIVIQIISTDYIISCWLILIVSNIADIVILIATLVYILCRSTRKSNFARRNGKVN